MSVILSVATSKDGYIDDNSPNRLVLSTPEDWAEVYSLRADADAIVIGAETLRRDNPRLRIKDQSLVEQRIARGLSHEPHKVIISGSGAIDPALRIFAESNSKIIIFSNIERQELNKFAEIVVEKEITAAFIVTELEKRGILNIFIEGGAKILNLFFKEHIAHTLRVAVNPNIVVNDTAAPHLTLPEYLSQVESKSYNLGGMEITNYIINKDIDNRDREYMQRAIDLSRLCKPSPTSYCVGAVAVTTKGEIFEGYTHESSPTHHAEQEAINKGIAAGADFCGATIYSSMEPCSQRASEPESCSQIVIRLGFARALFALYEPNCFVECKGACNMRKAGIEVECLASFADQVLEINKHLSIWNQC